MTIQAICYSCMDPANTIIGFIGPDTTPADFDRERSSYPSYKLEKGNPEGNTALSLAASKGNLDLIDHIIKIGDEFLLKQVNSEGYAPLHMTCLSENEEKGYLAAKRLIHLGTPVNLVLRNIIFYGQTPLEYALIKKKIKIAALFLRLGGKAQFYPPVLTLMQSSLKRANAHIDADNERLFLMKEATERQLPEEIVKLIAFNFV